MYELLITEAAEQDLDGIVEYIAVRLANPSAAGSFLDAVEACYENLRRTPKIYSECADAYLKSRGYRKALIKNYNYVLVFRFGREANKVYVLRFFYAGQDYGKQLL
ncbi:MAG TPA: type II toxin-antitoxin system RelE/ParE family toxin [Kiritimatiellia bacterium]|nr:type II toxin-antitoxin system RelE/ParE family toxin [Kiritimatiellia bacterium]